MKIKDETLTARQIAVLEQTKDWNRVLLSGALGSGKTLICILKIIAAIEAAPLTTKVLFWVVSCREGQQDVELKLFEKVRTAVAQRVKVRKKSAKPLSRVIVEVNDLCDKILNRQIQGFLFLIYLTF